MAEKDIKLLARDHTAKLTVELELESRSQVWSSSCQLRTSTYVPSPLLDASGDNSH